MLTNIMAEGRRAAILKIRRRVEDPAEVEVGSLTDLPSTT